MNYKDFQINDILVDTGGTEWKIKDISTDWVSSVSSVGAESYYQFLDNSRGDYTTKEQFLGWFVEHKRAIPKGYTKDANGRWRYKGKWCAAPKVGVPTPNTVPVTPPDTTPVKLEDLTFICLMVSKGTITSITPNRLIPSKYKNIPATFLRKLPAMYFSMYNIDFLWDFTTNQPTGKTVADIPNAIHPYLDLEGHADYVELIKAKLENTGECIEKSVVDASLADLAKKTYNKSGDVILYKSVGVPNIPNFYTLLYYTKSRGANVIRHLVNSPKVEVGREKFESFPVETQKQIILKLPVKRNHSGYVTVYPTVDFLEDTTEMRRRIIAEMDGVDFEIVHLRKVKMHYISEGSSYNPDTLNINKTLWYKDTEETRLNPDKFFSWEEGKDYKKHPLTSYAGDAYEIYFKIGRKDVLETYNMYIATWEQYEAAVKPAHPSHVKDRWADICYITTEFCERASGIYDGTHLQWPNQKRMSMRSWIMSVLSQRCIERGLVIPTFNDQYVSKQTKPEVFKRLQEMIAK